MAYQAIGLGTTEGDGTGDSIRDGGDKVNDNFVEIYTLLGTGTALSSGISATATVVTLTSPVISGVLALADGSASAPSFTNNGDTNTGIYFSAADTVSVTTGGTLRLDIDSTGLDVTGGVAISTTLTQVGVATFTARDIHNGGITIGDGDQIGSASALDALVIASSGVVTFDQIPVLPANSILIGNLVDNSITEAKMANDAISSAELKTLSTLLIKNSGGSTLATFHTAGA
jgi:hypothetical protein